MPRSNGACQTENPSVSYYFVETSEERTTAKDLAGIAARRQFPLSGNQRLIPIRKSVVVTVVYFVTV